LPRDGRIEAPMRSPDVLCNLERRGDSRSFEHDTALPPPIEE
jgi:hypothetical protein